MHDRTREGQYVNVLKEQSKDSPGLHRVTAEIDTLEDLAVGDETEGKALRLEPRKEASGISAIEQGIYDPVAIYQAAQYCRADCARPGDDRRCI